MVCKKLCGTEQLNIPFYPAGDGYMELYADEFTEKPQQQHPRLGAWAVFQIEMEGFTLQELSYDGVNTVYVLCDEQKIIAHLPMVGKKPFLFLAGLLVQEVLIEKALALVYDHKRLVFQHPAFFITLVALPREVNKIFNEYHIVAPHNRHSHLALEKLGRGQLKIKDCPAALAVLFSFAITPETNKPEAVLCPKCYSPMVIRTARKDGKKFYGCSNFPNCKETVYYPAQ